jgi:hypothetical protein
MIPLAIDDPAECRARLRSLRIGVRILCGPLARELELALARAERDPAELSRIDGLIDALPPFPRRRLLATWAQTLNGRR